MRDDDSVIEGRNVVLEAFRSGKTIDRLFVQDGLNDGPYHCSGSKKAEDHY